MASYHEAMALWGGPPTTPMADLMSRVSQIVKDKQDENRTKNALLFEDMEHLFDEWVDAPNIENRILEAAGDGRSSIALAEFKRSELYRNHPILLMVLGPIRDRAYFSRMGEYSLLDRLKLHFSPFEVHHRFDRATDTNTIFVSWEFAPPLV